MENISQYLSLGLSIIAVLTAFWQGYLAKEQLEQAKDTKRRTEDVLHAIEEKVSQIQTISDETRKDVRENISKVIDKQDENLKMLLKAPTENNQNQMIAQLLPAFINSDNGMDTLIKLAELGNKK